MRRRETGVGIAIPLHRRAGSGTFVAAFLRQQPVLVAHADFVAVVDERATGQGQQEREGEFHLARGESVAHADHVMVARRHADVSQSFGVDEHGLIRVYERLDVTVGGGGEIRVLSKQVEVVRGAEM